MGAIGTVAACGGRSTAMSVRDGPQKSPEAQSPVQPAACNAHS